MRPALLGLALGANAQGWRTRPCAFPTLHGTLSDCHRCPEGSYCPGDGQAYPCSRCAEASTPCTGSVDALCADAVVDALRGVDVRRPVASMRALSTLPPCRLPGYVGDAWASCAPCPEGSYCPGDGEAHDCASCDADDAPCTAVANARCENLIEVRVRAALPSALLKLLDGDGVASLFETDPLSLVALLRDRLWA